MCVCVCFILSALKCRLQYDPSKVSPSNFLWMLHFHCVAGVSDKYGTVGTTVDQPFLGYNNFSFRKGLYFQGFYSALALNLSLIISRAFITSTTYVLGFSACPSAHEKTPTGPFILSWHLWGDGLAKHKYACSPHAVCFSLCDDCRSDCTVVNDEYTIQLDVKEMLLAAKMHTPVRMSGSQVIHKNRRS